MRHADGSWHWHEIIARNMLAHPAVQAIVSHQRDITERRAVQDKIAHAASHDALTGLANGPTLTRDLERALAAGTRYQHPVAVLFCDLDGFKAVNDTYGHDVGDRLLQTISGVIRRVTRDTDTAGRIGGDEFGVVLTRVNTTGGGAERGPPDHRGDHHQQFGGRPQAGRRLQYRGGPGLPGRLGRRNADASRRRAMYRSKRQGRNGSQIYVPEEIAAPWS